MPALTPVTTPVETTVDIPVDEELHAPLPGLLASEAVLPAHTLAVPVIAVGCVFTVTVVVTVTPLLV